MSISGYQSKMGIGLEANAGTPVQAQALLHYRSDSVEGQFNNIISTALVYGRFRGGAAPSNETVAGQFPVEMTPDKVMRLVYAALGKETVIGGEAAVAGIVQAAGVATCTTTPDHNFQTGDIVTIAGADQANYNGDHAITKTGAKTFTFAVPADTVTPATGATITATGPYRHTLTATQAGPKPFTHSIAKGLVDVAGSIVQVHNGCYIDNLELNADVEQFLLGTFEVQGLSEQVYTYSTANDTALFGAAAASALNPYSYVQGALVLNGLANEECRNIRIRIANALREKRVLKRQRAAVAHAPGTLELTLDAQLYFSSDAERKRLMGVAADVATPYGSATAVIPGSASLDFASGNAGLTIALANLVYTAAGSPVESDDWIMQPVTATVTGDPAGGITVTVKNAEETLSDSGTPL